MAQGVFSLKTLNDNWFEDRLQPAESLTATGSLHLKKPRPVETDLAYLGERYHPLTRTARLPPRTSYAIPDDGFSETQTTHKADYAHPRSHGEPRGPTAPSLINTANAPVLPPEKRELDGPPSGFGAAIHRHPANHDQRFFSTTHGDFFGEHGPRTKKAPPLGYSASASSLIRSKSEASGISSEHQEERAKGSGKKVGQLTGEPWRESTNPAKDTKTQKQWLYAPCPGITNVHLGGSKKRVLGPDNEMSLPLGEGNMLKIREAAKLRQGMFARSATHITRGAHLLPGVTVFQDE